VSTKQIFILIGPPGSGKTTYAEAVIKRNGFRLLSGGQLLRDYAKKKSSSARKVAKILTTGRLVPNYIIDNLVKQALNKPSVGFVFDGYPRTLAQAKKLSSFIRKKKWPPPTVVKIEVADSEIIRRLSSRVYCPVGGEPYVAPQKFCPKHNVRLIRRPDDEPSAIKQRLQIYRKNFKPILDYFKKFSRVVSFKSSARNTLKQNIQVLISTLEKYGLL
jgi:adenylate kinase